MAIRMGIYRMDSACCRRTPYLHRLRTASVRCHSGPNTDCTWQRLVHLMGRGREREGGEGGRKGERGGGEREGEGGRRGGSDGPRTKG